MSNRGRRRRVDKAQAVKYHRVGIALLQSATDLLNIAEEHDTYGNAIAIVVIHAAIAYTDALTIGY